jgi:thiol:disulfide interchange protein DsbD
MGLTVGIVAAPCIGPAILALFTYVAAQGSVPLGFSVFFVFALGLGFPFLLLASVSGAVSRLPRSGEWMVWVKHFFGFLLLAMALYFLRPRVGDAVFSYGILVLGLVAGVFLGFLDRAGRGSAGFRKLRAVVGVLVAALSLGVFASSRSTGAERIAWRSYEEAAFTRALGSGRPVLVDFTAEWCIACKELEHLTFTDERVGQAASRFAAFRADVTDERDPVVTTLRDRFGVLGYPTIVFIDSKGTERSDLRVTGFVPPEKFEGLLQRVD